VRIKILAVGVCQDDIATRVGNRSFLPKIPIIAAKFPILEAAKANDLLASGNVVGNVVLVAPELM
jgi:NADPH:quinone reductase-like Zn-dependent oxidoreductase